jgi:myo-inositol-1(or 4)-monophosphatase
VHSNEQIRASPDSGGRSRSQHSQFGFRVSIGTLRPAIVLNFEERQDAVHRDPHAATPAVRQGEACQPSPPADIAPHHDRRRLEARHTVGNAIGGPANNERVEPMPASALMNVMVAAVRKAGRSLARDFGEVEQLQVSVKGPANFVSAADHRAEDILYNELSRARHGYGFLMEERGAVEGPDKSHRWIVDPLDGTTNFLHGIPHFAISVGLEREGEMVAGVIYNPASNDLFTAEKGKGSFVNDRRLRVANRRSLTDCVVVTGIPHRGRPGHKRFLAECGAVMAETSGVRRYGAAALDLAWVAAGRFDAYWEHAIQPWDMAAGLLMVREAGGIVSDLEGRQEMFGTGGIIAGNAAIQKQLLALLQSGR